MGIELRMRGRCPARLVEHRVFGESGQNAQTSMHSIFPGEFCRGSGSGGDENVRVDSLRERLQASPS